MNNVQVAASDNTIVGSANTYGAYLRRTTGSCAGADNGGWGTTYAAPCWEQLFTQTSSAQTLVQITQLQPGVLEIDSCNNNTNDAYAFTQKALYVTTNLKAAAASRTWAKTPLTTTIGGNQGVSAGTGRAIGCDPANPNVVYAATPAGVNVSGNGLAGVSASFAVISTAKIGTTGTIPSAIAFDPTSSSATCAAISGSPTCTQHFWIFTAGSGVYETYNGGTTFTLTTGGPTTPGNSGGAGPHCMVLREDQFGKVWAVIGDTKVYKYTPNGSAGGGTWTTSTVSFPAGEGNTACYLGVDPSSGSAGTLRLVASTTYGSITVSTNGGGTWSTAVATTFSAPGGQPPWMGNANQGQANGTTLLFLSDYAFDTSGNLFAAGGIGIWQMPTASVAAGGNWAADSIGIENLVTNHVDAPLGQAPFAAFWDRAFFPLANSDTFPSRQWMDGVYNSTPGVGAIQGGWAVDYASNNTNFLTGWAGDSGNFGASSSAGGTNWVVWPSVGAATTNTGGMIAASTPTNWVWIPAGNSTQLFFTTNGATTSWTAATIAGQTNPLGSVKQSGFALAADRVNANTFCLVDSGQNLFASTNSGQNWSKNSTALNGLAARYNDALKAVPGQAGTFYYSGGNSGGSVTTFSFYKITKTTSECDTVTAVNASITDVYGYGFGAAKPGGNGFPVIYFWGALSGVYGLYEIDNGGTTPTLLNVPVSQQTWPNNSQDFIADVAGDMNFYGRVRVGFVGSGIAYIDKQDACPWVEFSNVNPNAALTGTVTLSAAHSGLVPVTGVQFSVDGSNIGSSQTGQSTYSVSWNASGVAPGAHTLKVQATGNGCAASGNSFSIPITTSFLIARDLSPANDNTPMWLNAAA